MTPELRQILAEIGLAIVSAIGVVLLAAIRAGITRLAEYTGVKLTESDRQLLDQAASDAVAYAEEWSRKSVREGKPAPVGAAKLTTALGAVRTFAGRAAAAYTDQQLAQLLEARLARSRGSLWTADDDERVTLPPPAPGLVPRR